MKQAEKAITGGVFRWLGCVCLVIVFIFLTGLSGDKEVRADEQVVKVGYVPAQNFVKETDGDYSGYCVDYLDEIAMYTGWTYEYVAGTWQQCLDRVENGEIDILCMVQYTDERAEKFIFSEESMGNEAGLIYARDDSEVYYRDYAMLNGSTIAMMPNTVYDDRLTELEQLQGITFKRVYYDTVDEVMAALLGGETDLAILGSIYGFDGAKIVGQDDAYPIYCVTGKDNQALMDTFDEALRQTKLNDAGIESRLYQRYYEESMISSEPLYTREEIGFIEEQDEVVVKLMVGNRPLCYEEDGQLQGIFVEYLKLFEEKMGLTIRIEKTTSDKLNEDTESQQEMDYLTLRSKRVVDYMGLEEGLICSHPIIETSLGYVKRVGETSDSEKKDYIFAITNEMSYYLEDIIKRGSSSYQVKYYDSTEECMEAVIAGEADIVAQDTYRISYLMQKPEYSDKLAECSGEEIINGMCLIGSSDDEILIGIFDKVIDYISDDEIKEIVSEELKNNPYHMTMGDILYEYHRWIAVILFMLVAGIVIYTVLTRRMANLKVQRKEYEMLRKKVQQDELTGVYNKKYFYEKAGEMIAHSEEEMCIIMMDITNFKMVNDLFGINNGDKLLKYMAGELVNLSGDRDVIVARFNADHFYMCMSEKDFKEINFPKKYKRTPVENMDVRVTYGVFSVGELKDVPVNIMCDRASMATHDREVKGGQYIFYYSEDDRKKMLRQQEIEGEMENALEQHQFCVYIQPKYDIYKKKIVGGEALARWIHPDKGMISPGDFIPVFEKNGFIRFLDYYIWEETCRLIAEIKEKGLTNVPLSINVSRAHFASRDLKDKLLELLARYNLRPEELELEITETIYVEDSDVINGRIKELQDMGFRIAMDDFGSGYSSLNMLKEIPLDIIKMDLKFLDSSENIEKSHKILDSLIDLAKRLDLYVVVEGVETEEQVEFLQGVGEMSAQGYYFSRPVDTDKYEELLVLDRIS